MAKSDQEILYTCIQFLDTFLNKLFDSDKRENRLLLLAMNNLNTERDIEKR